MPRLIAERSIDLLKPTGERLRFRVSFGPISSSRGEFRCRVRFHGWGDSPPDVWGSDSLQSLILAIQLVHAILAEFVRRGGRVLWPGTAADYSLSDFLCLQEASKARRKATGAPEHVKKASEKRLCGRRGPDLRPQSPP